MELKIINPNQIKKVLLQAHNIKEITLEVNNAEEYTNLLLENIEYSNYPLAVNPHLIIDQNNEEECIQRAKNIIELMIDKDLYGLSILDFGCGDGLLANEITDAKVIGYDIVPHKFWKSDILTTDWSKVIENAPYDFILLYDVIDHIMNEEPVQVLSKLKDLLSPKGSIVLRCHPWTARHGGHLYNNINRAFIHLIFDEEQLKKLRCTPTPTKKIIHPVMTYKKWFSAAGLRIIKEDKIVEPIEEYFNNEFFKEIVQRHYSESPLPEFREGRGDVSKILGMHFLDYVLGI